MKLLREQVARLPGLKNSKLNIKVATVDGFQGSEVSVVKATVSRRLLTQ